MKKLARAARASELEPYGRFARFNRELKSQKAAAATFGVDDLRDRLKKPRLGIEPDTVAIAQFRPLRRASHQSTQKIVAPRLERVRTECACNRKIG